MKSKSKDFYPCPVCGNAKDVRMTQKSSPKPYLICDECGVQLFVRRDSGIAQFTKCISRRFIVKRPEIEGREAALVSLTNWITELSEKVKGLSLTPLKKRRAQRWIDRMKRELVLKRR